MRYGKLSLAIGLILTVISISSSYFNIDLAQKFSPYMPFSYIPMMTLILTTAFCFVISGMITSLESMRRYKLFEESLPISKAKRYLLKTTFVSINTTIYWIVQAIIIGVIYFNGKYSVIFDILLYLEQTLLYVLIFLGFSMLFVFIGNYCGNIVSYFGSSFIAFLGSFFIRIVIVFFMRPILMISEKLEVIFYFSIAEKLDKPWLRPAGLIIGNPIDQKNVIAYFFIFTIILVAIGVLLTRYIEVERSGMFYNIKFINKLYYALLILVSAVVSLSMVPNYYYEDEVSMSLKLINWLIFIVLLFGFSKIYKYFFKAKLTF